MSVKNFAEIIGRVVSEIVKMDFEALFIDE
jgi:hypothetical protein